MEKDLFYYKKKYKRCKRLYIISMSIILFIYLYNLYKEKIVNFLTH